MRSAYLASKKPKATGEDGGEEYSYIYAAEMSFLAPCLENRAGYKINILITFQAYNAGTLLHSKSMLNL
jgi:hypothetical protein